METGASRHGKTRVWVVEDDANQLDLLARRLRGCGWFVRGFADGDAMEQALVDDLPHVLILDRLLPRQSGTHLLQRLRQRGYRFPVLMLSALGSADERITGLETGADDYMAKPFLWRELQLRLERLLDDRRDLKPQRSSNQIFKLGQVRFDPGQLLLEGPGGQSRLTRGDASLLSQLCQAPGIVFERAQLLQATGSLVDVSTTSTLAMRFSKLRRLLNNCLPGSGEMLEAVRGRGYRLNSPVQALPAP
jgi:DNA-binding response OmpR family regulator